MNYKKILSNFVRLHDEYIMFNEEKGYMHLCKKQKFNYN
jgi:hypothetical protein